MSRAIRKAITTHGRTGALCGSHASTATIDGDGGLGVILGPKAMRIAIDKAKAVGVGIVTMYNGRHLGAVGHHAMLAAQEDMVEDVYDRHPAQCGSRPLG